MSGEDENENVKKTEYFSDLVPGSAEAEAEATQGLTAAEEELAGEIVAHLKLIERKTYYPIKLNILSRSFIRKIKKLNPGYTCASFVEQMERVGLCAIEVSPTGKYKVVYSKDMHGMIEQEPSTSFFTHLAGMERALNQMKAGVPEPDKPVSNS